MSRLAKVASLPLVAIVCLACNAPQETAAPAATPATSQDSATVVARVAGAPITAGDLDAWIRDDLFAREFADKGRAEVFEIRSDALERMIDERLLEAEAKQRGVGVEQVLAQQLTNLAEIQDADVRSFYEENKSRMGSATFEQIAPRIRRFLEEREAGEARQEFVRSLREKAKVAVELAAPRIEVAADGPSRGAENAPVTIVEFSDYQCPFCKRAEPVIDEILAKYPDRVRVVYRHFPLDQIHPRARPAAEASLCAGEQGKFWEFHEKLFSGEGLEEADLVAYAEAVGLDKAKFEACVSERRFQKQVEADLAAARAAGVSGTPAFFVNGIMLSGAQPVEKFVEIIERELASAPQG